MVTGLTGRAGSAFYEVLCRERISERIRVVVRKSTNLDMFLDSPLDLDIVVGDITDTTFLQGAMEGCKTVFHIASKRMIQPLADAIQNAPSVKNVVMVSSTIVYSEHYRLVDSLADDEAICVEKFQHRGIRYIFLRPTMIFGRPDERQHRAAQRTESKLPGPQQVEAGHFEAHDSNSGRHCREPDRHRPLPPRSQIRPGGPKHPNDHWGHPGKRLPDLAAVRVPLPEIFLETGVFLRVYASGGKQPPAVFGHKAAPFKGTPALPGGLAPAVLWVHRQ